MEAIHMAEVPTLTEYDGKKAKVRCSIQWIILEAYRDETKISKVLPKCDITQVFESDGGLKKNVSHLLCGGEPYCRIASKMFNLIEPLRSHEDVIQMLCSKGLYVLDDADALITANDLRKMPLELGSHLTIINMLMFAYLSNKLISINSLVMTVRKFSEFSASRELPDNLEEALMLWLNKVSLKVQINHRNSLESDKHTFGQQREDDSHFPSVSNLTEDLYDGRSLALLLHYYCPEHILFKDISLKDPISIADAWNNLQMVFDFCNNIILPQNSTLTSVLSPSVLHPVDLLYCGREMKLNIMLLLGMIYHNLECNALENVVSPLGHTVLCRRKRDHSFEDMSNGVADPNMAFMTSQEKRHQTLEASQLVPGVQPLISDVTRQSFRKPTPDTDSLSTITLNESEGRGSPAPFSSKPLLVRRNRDQYHPRLSPTSKPYTQTPVQRLPVIAKDFRHDSDETESTNSGYYSLRESNSYPGFSEDLNPVVNKWRLRNAVMDLRNVNSSNNTYVHRGDGYSTDRTTSNTFSKTTSDTNSAETSGLLSNVEIETENETVHHHSQLTGLDRTASPSESSYLPTSELRNQLTSFDGNRNRNDMILESARTSEFGSARTCPSLESHSSMTSDLTLVSSRTTSSNEVGSQDFTRSGATDNYSSRDIPSLISADESPDLPRNVTRVKPYQSSDTGASSVSAPSSQKSYTIQNGEFQSVNSARAAGYPIIETSPQNQPRPVRVLPDMQASRFSQSSQRLMNPTAHESGDLGRSAPMKTEPAKQDEMVVGGTVVKLRSPQKKTNRIIRTTKASSWMDDSDQNILNRPSHDQQRRHSNSLLDPDHIAVVLKKCEQRRRVEEEGRMAQISAVMKKSDQRRLMDMKGMRNMMRKEVTENERRIEGKDWRKWPPQPRTKGSPSSSSQRSDNHHEQQLVSNHMMRNVCDDKLGDKNEETSSDYSSKSPSPSSLSNTEGRGLENRTKPIARQSVHSDDASSASSHQNFFASPLSATMCLVPPKGQRSLENASTSHQRNLNQHKTFDVPDREAVAQAPPVSQPRIKSATHASAFTSPHDNHAARVSKSLTSIRGSRSRDLTVNSPGLLGRSQEKAVDNGIGGENSTMKHDQKIPDSNTQVQPGPNSSVDAYHKAPVRSRQITYDVSSQFAEDLNAHLSSSLPSAGQHDKSSEVLGSGPPTQPTISVSPDVNILQPLQPEHTTRRTLFPVSVPQDRNTSVEQENINPNHLSIAGGADQTTYDTFSHKIVGLGSNQSTPCKISPSRMQDVVTPPEDDGETDMSSVLTKTADRDRKGGRGFELLDEATPNADLAKKKEQFLLKQLKKEEELKKKRADREKLEEKKKEEARQKKEELAAKKEEEKLKRQQIFEEYKKKKMQQEEAQLMQQSSTIVSGGNLKKHLKPDSAPHAGRIGKSSRSGRSSPAPDSQPLVARTYSSPNLSSPSGENQSTFLVSGKVDKNGNMVSTRMRRQSPSRKDWETESASSSAVSSDYTGPKLYKQPSAKSNKHIVYNAICHCCLPGKVNEPQRNSTIQVLEMLNEKHFMILFRDAKCQYRALYTYMPDEEKLHRISGNGPHTIVPSMIERLFKYNSGRKAFTALSSKTLSVSIDGITIKNALWQKKPSSAKK